MELTQGQEPLGPDPRSIMIEPVFGYTRDGITPHKPNLKEILSEWLDATNFTADSNRTLIALNCIFFASSGLAFGWYVIHFLSLATLLFLIASLIFIGTVYNTLWYHRYCSHHAFKFARQDFARVLLWTTPLFFRESTYAIPHRIHHQYTDKPGDPYGPHLGWLGSFLAIDSSMKLNANVTERRYELMVRSIDHIGFKINDYESYRRTGSLENVWHYLTKALIAQLFWTILILPIGGLPYLMAWYAAIFMATALIRDFNWRGHGGNFRDYKIPAWEFDTSSTALNQRFYGFIASEWHNNHHKYPHSANNGLLPSQIDIAFLLIKLMHKMGVVECYNDAQPTFARECLGKKHRDWRNLSETPSA